MTHVEFGGTSGWTLTERGRSEDSKRLAEELDQVGARAAVEQAHGEFEVLNGRLVKACTDWQLRPNQVDRLAANDHSDPQWDARVLDELSAIAGELTQLISGLFGSTRAVRRLRRAVLRRAGPRPCGGEAVGGRHRVASCHTVWMELHEDLLSTLGIPRGAEA